MDLDADLKELVAAFQARFPSDREAYNFLYRILKQQSRLNLRQCKCTTKYITAFYRNYRSYFGLSKYTGGSGYPLPDKNRSRRFNIPNPLPDTLSLKDAEKGVFAECKHKGCHSRYRITSNTIFYNKNTPIRSQLAMLLITEYYNFDPNNGAKILSAMKEVMGKTNLIKSSFSENVNEESTSGHTLNRYKDLFTATENHEELRSYRLIEYLG
jgi:hypothetical protein